METTALSMAAGDDCDAIVKLLIEKGARVNPRHAPEPPLVIAVSKNRKTVVRLLLEKGADPNATQRYDNTTVLNIAAMKGSSEIVSMLLNKGANTELGDKSGDTPLHTAIMKNRCKIIQLLLEGGADVGSRDRSGRTMLDLAMTHGSQRLLSLFLKKVANLNAPDSWPLHTAISNGKIAQVQLLLDHGVDVNRRDQRARLLCFMLCSRDMTISSNFCCFTMSTQTPKEYTTG